MVCKFKSVRYSHIKKESVKRVEISKLMVEGCGLRTDNQDLSDSSGRTFVTNHAILEHCKAPNFLLEDILQLFPGLRDCP